jgi:hypothetical protein
LTVIENRVAEVDRTQHEPLKHLSEDPMEICAFNHLAGSPKTDDPDCVELVPTGNRFSDLFLKATTMSSRPAKPERKDPLPLSE